MSVREVATSGGLARVHVYPTMEAKPPRGTVLLGHGAGAGVESGDLQSLTDLVEHGWCVALLEQPWRVAGRRLAVAPPKLDLAANDMLDAVSACPDPLPRPWVLGGRSAGARVACRLSERAEALLLIAFPLQPPRVRGRQPPSRVGELLLPVRLGLPVLILQGERDRFGRPEDVREALRQQHQPSSSIGGSPSDGDKGATLIGSYPGDHGPSRDGASLVDDARRFLDALA